MHFEQVRADSADAQRCLAAYFAEAGQRLDTGFDPELSTPADADELAAPNGTFLLLRDADGRPVGCGGVRALDDRTGEIKRMWVDPRARGLGFGRRLLAELEHQARDLGLRRVVLDTNAALVEARALYSSAGYVECAPYNDNVYADAWYEKDLGRA